MSEISDTQYSETQDYKLYKIWHNTKTKKATGQTRYALESLESQLSNTDFICPVPSLGFVLCQIVYDL